MTSSPVTAAPTTDTLITKETILRLTFYEIFHVDPTTSVIDVAALHRAYRRLSLLFHPDKDPSPEARKAFEWVKLGLDTLTDPTKRYDYDAAQSASATSAGGNGGQATEEGQQRRQQAEETARWAEEALKRKEMQTASEVEARRQEMQAREEAAERMLQELTHTLRTPFAQMEAELVGEWDIDVDVLHMKQKEVDKLLQELQLHTTDGEWSPVGQKRQRVVS